MLQHKLSGASGNRRESVIGFPGTQALSTTAVLEVPCDILIPAAVENQITAENARSIKARLIAEAANGPTMPEADDILIPAAVENQITDILANADGVTVSYFERVQDLQRYFWDIDETRTRLTKIMQTEFDSVADMAREYNVDMRKAATMLAVSRVAKATTLRGIYPYGLGTPHAPSPSTDREETLE